MGVGIGLGSCVFRRLVAVVTFGVPFPSFGLVVKKMISNHCHSPSQAGTFVASLNLANALVNKIIPAANPKSRAGFKREWDINQQGLEWKPCALLSSWLAEVCGADGKGKRASTAEATGAPKRRPRKSAP